VNVISFLALRFKRMSFDMDFLLPRPRKISYICIELNLYMMLQLKISLGLTNVVVISFDF
jgi:hypothetical protein